MKIIINRHNLDAFNIFSKYFGYNIYHFNHNNNSTNNENNIGNNKKNNYDKNIIKLEIDILTKNKSSILELDIDKDKKNIPIFEPGNCSFDFSYQMKINDNNEIMNCKIEINSFTGNAKPYKAFMEKPSKIITITFNEMNSYKLFSNFINYVDIFVKCNITKKKYSINSIKYFCNDESYWEELDPKTTRNMDTIYLPKKDKNTIINDIEWFLDEKTIQKYKKLGRTHKRIYLFEGLPGSGKTSFITALASKFDYNIAMINFTDKVTDGILIRLIKKLPEKTFLILEDIDCLFEDRKQNDNMKNTVTLSGILNSLDGIVTPDDFICFITTNYKFNLDNALLRPGRIDKILNFTYANKEQIKDIFKSYMDEKYTDDYFKDFYNKFKKLNIKLTVNIIQEYLFKYIDNPEIAIENIDEIKELYDSSNKKEANLYM
jgi:ATP-dependent Zn protease